MGQRRAQTWVSGEFRVRVLMVTDRIVPACAAATRVGYDDGKRSGPGMDRREGIAGLASVDVRDRTMGSSPGHDILINYCLGAGCAGAEGGATDAAGGFAGSVAALVPGLAGMMGAAAGARAGAGSAAGGRSVAGLPSLTP